MFNGGRTGRLGSDTVVAHSADTGEVLKVLQPARDFARPSRLHDAINSPPVSLGTGPTLGHDGILRHLRACGRPWLALWFSASFGEVARSPART